MDTVEDNLHFNRIGLPNADESNWRERAAELIGDEEVEFKGYRVTGGKYPIVAVSSSEKDAIDRVFEKVIAES